jgi:hypothetical protein
MFLLVIFIIIFLTCIYLYQSYEDSDTSSEFSDRRGSNDRRQNLQLFPFPENRAPMDRRSQ